jgi:hypothetical protein
MAISARSGMVHYMEGKVFIGDQELDGRFGQFPDVKEGQTLKTTEGRAEILLTPGVFLRVAENSSFKMISSRLIDTRVDLLSGSILIECAELQKDNAVTFLYNDTTVELKKKALIRLDTEAGLLRIYDGEAVVSKAGQTLTLKEGKETLLSGVFSPEKFDNKTGDAFYRWASRRAGSLAVANISAAKSLRDSSTSWISSGWLWNPLFGSFTFIPARGFYNSPFGYNYYSPGYVIRVYNSLRPVSLTADNSAFVGSGMGRGSSSGYNANLGYNTASRGQATSMSPSSGNAAAAAPAPSSGAGRSGGDAGGSHGSGRGR